MLPDLIDIPCTNSQDNVAGFSGSAKFRFELFKSREETCSFNLIRQGGRGNADGVLLARGEDFRQEDHVRALQQATISIIAKSEALLEEQQWMCQKIKKAVH